MSRPRRKSRTVRGVVQWRCAGPCDRWRPEADYRRAPRHAACPVQSWCRACDNAARAARRARDREWWRAVARQAARDKRGVCGGGVDPVYARLAPQRGHAA